MRGDYFEWDDQKAVSNLAKHGISFEDALRALLDENVCDHGVDLHAGETRYINIGMVDGVVLQVVTADGDNGRERLISARKATKNEHKAYFAQK